MKVKLDNLTVGEFIDLMTWDTKCLGRFALVKADTPQVIRDILIEYRSIADPAGARSYLAEGNEYSKARNSVLFFSICESLLSIGEFDQVRKLLGEYGINVERAADSMVKAQVKSKLAKARNTLKRIDEGREEIKSSPDIRREFEEQTAALMAHFKFQIDIDVMKVSIYAHLVARYHREIKAQLEASKKKH